MCSRRPAPAISHLDDLAQRWLYQYLPDRLQSYRRAVLADLRNAAQLARGQEDASHERLEELRQVQLSQLVQTASNDAVPSPPPQPIASPAPSAATIAEREKSREKLELLRLELSRLAANCTDQHPQVVTLRSQIAALERQLGAAEGEKPRAAETPVLMAPATSGQQSGIEPAAGTARRASHFVTVSAATTASPNAAADLAMQINAVAAQLAAASRQRQAAEHRLADRMQELSSQPTAAQWTARPAQAVTRLGGTPRSSMLALGGLLASVAGALAFRAARDSAMAGAIGSIADLELPSRFRLWPI